MARRPHSDDLDQRIFRYLVSMGIRTVCVILVIVVHHPVRWVFAVGAVVLPYIAVVLANATDRRTVGLDSVPVDRRILGSAAAHHPATPAPPAPQAPSATPAQPAPPGRSGQGEVLTGVIVQPPASAAP